MVQSNAHLIDQNERPVILSISSNNNYINDQSQNNKNNDISSSPILNAGSQPLTRDVTQLINLNEILYLPDSQYSGGIFDDVSTGFSETNQLFDNEDILEGFIDTLIGFLGGFKSGLSSGDVDGDGTDEAIIVTKDDDLKIYDDTQHSYNKRTFHFEKPSEASDLGNLKTVACGDVDGDGIDEIAIVCSYHIDSINNFKLYLWVFDAVDGRFYTIANPKSVCSASYNAMSMEPEIALGDLDGDGLDEIVIGHSFGKEYLTTPDIWIYDDYIHSFNLLWKDNLYFENQYKGWIADVDLACGDFDGDRKDEIAYTACIWNGEQLEGALLIIDDSGAPNYGEIAEFQIAAPGGVWVCRMPVDCGDIDGDGLDEIVFIRCYSEEYPGDVFIFEYSPSIGDYKHAHSLDWSFPDYVFAMGDIDCDGLAELVFSGRYGNHVVDDENHSFNHIMDRPLGAYGLIVCGDIDGDGMRIKYTGESWLATAPPGIIAVLAGPPVYYGIQQNYDWSWTAFGKSTSISTTETKEIGVRSSSTISFQQSFSIGFFEVLSFSWSRTVGEEMTRTKTATQTQVQEISYSSGCWLDSIIYHLTDYNCYKYQIIYHPFEPSLVGNNITIDIPITSAILKTTIGYFEEYYNQSIRTETFNHTLGKPWTYPHRNETANYASDLLDSGDPISVGQGGGNNVVNIQIENEASVGFSLTKFSEYSMGGAVCGAGYSQSRGTSDAKGYEITIGNTCIYEGSIGDIKNYDRFEQLQYSIGLFIYYFTHTDGFTYQVINYYVEGAEIFTPSEIVAFLNTNWQWITGTAAGLSTIAIAVPLIVRLSQKSKIKKTTSKRSTPKKATTKKATDKKPSSKKATSKKASDKKATTKKTTTTKKSTKK
ncbi:MAG: VCBS repeat-containing protein [Asgard group archaeon]|nr:VCBS repeat-containing protein [Asgard group archaeon]